MSATPQEKLAHYQSSVALLAFVSSHYPHLVGKPLEDIVARLSPARHSADFRSVRWFGSTYHFSPAQSLIVECLWKSWEGGTPRMGARTLLRAASMVSDKISDLFKGHASWGKMICTDGKGQYWLCE